MRSKKCIGTNLAQWEELDRDRTNLFTFSTVTYRANSSRGSIYNRGHSIGARISIEPTITMDLISLQALISSLLINISTLSGYAIPEQLPKVYLVSAAEIQRRVYDKPCRARAFYALGEGIFLDASLDLTRNMYERSILVHELVHALQHSSGKFEYEGNGCTRYEVEEVEAYDVQNKFLSQPEDPRRFAFLAAPAACQDTPNPATQ